MGSKTKKSTQTYKPPEWVTGASQQAIGLGQKIGSQKYSAYNGERVAGLSDNEQKGMTMASETAGAGQPYYEQAGALAERGSQQFQDADMAGYMNPYIENALDPAARKINERGAGRAMELDSQASSMDAFGGSRAALMRGENEASTIQGISDLYKTGLADAYNSAVGIWGDERSRDMQAAGRFIQTGDAITNANKTDISTLMATGATDRNMRQAMADFDYSQFIEERDWDFRNLGGLIASLEGTKGSYGTETKTTEKTSGGGVAQALGVASALLGVFFPPAGAVAGAVTGAGLPTGP